ncbi:MAG: TetR/AcrR family transcriptional regulator [Oscillospiraceae bacterium]|nr:TetR/AcrR family transcriptional regulator [Oscillospiraceae bacterium]
MKRTELDILLALNRLIIRTDMNNITTEKIVQEAKISRATFYRYFKDKYDVLNRNYKELLDSCLNQSSNYRELFFRMYQHAQQEWSDFHRAFSTSGVNSFENYISTYSRSVVEKITTENRGGLGLTEEEQLQLDVFCMGISGMYKKWTLGQYALTADSAADALFSSMPATLRNYWFC